MRIFDANVMIGKWPTNKLRFSSCTELIEQMNSHEINCALVYSSYGVKHNPTEGNYMLMEEIDDYKKMLFPCWVILPTWEIETGRDILNDLIDNDVKAVRIFPNEHNFVIDDWMCNDMFSKLESIRMPLLINNIDISPSKINLICQSFPNLPMILMQCEYFLNRSLYRLMELHKNLYLETSTYFIYNGIEDIVKRFGASRIIFGTRMPFQEPGAALAMVRIADISPEKKQMIFNNNLENIMSGVLL